MRKIILCLVAIVAGNLLQAQHLAAPILQKDPVNLSISQPTLKSGSGTIIVNYASLDGADINYGWELNNYYTNNDTFTLDYAIQAYKWIVDDQTGEMHSYNNHSVTVDTVVYYLQHVNNSNTKDTLIVSLIALNSNGYPTSTILAADTTITDTSLTPNAGNSFLPFFSAFNYQLAQGQRFGIRIDYFGALQDTFSILSSMRNSCGNQCFASYSQYYANSYYYLNDPRGLAGFYPDPSGSALGYDCGDQDGNYGEDEVCEGFPIQNWLWYAQVTIDEKISVAASQNNVRVCDGDTASLSASAVSADPNVTYTWTPSATIVGSNTQATVKAKPTTTTTYTVKATDGSGWYDTDTVRVEVTSESPQASFLYNQITEFQYVFSNESTNADSYFWEFGDGNTSTATNPTHTYSFVDTYQVVLTATNVCGEHKAIRYILISGINDVEDAVANLNLFPNPTSGSVEVSFDVKDRQDVKVKVYNVKGQEVYTKSHKNFSGKFEETLDLSGLSKGIYDLQIITSEGVVNRKITLQ